MGKFIQNNYKIALVLVMGVLLIAGYQNCAWKLPDMAKDQASINGPIDPNIANEQLSLTLLLTRCYSCHANGHNDGGFGYVDDLEQLKSTGMIVEGNPLGSSLYMVIHYQEMPPNNPFSQSEKQALYDWILNMGQ